MFWSVYTWTESWSLYWECDTQGRAHATCETLRRMGFVATWSPFEMFDDQTFLPVAVRMSTV